VSRDNSKITKDDSKPTSPESLVKPSSTGSVELSKSELDKASGGVTVKTPTVRVPTVRIP
jgi:hypothetical protein